MKQATPSTVKSLGICVGVNSSWFEDERNFFEIERSGAGHKCRTATAHRDVLEE